MQISRRRGHQDLASFNCAAIRLPIQTLRAWGEANRAGRQLWLFSSRAQGLARPDSDVDVAIALMTAIGDHDWALGNYMALGAGWQRDLARRLGMPVSLEGIVPDTDGDEVVRRTGILLWERAVDL